MNDQGEKKCLICCKDLDAAATQTVKKLGIQKLINCSVERKDGLDEKLKSCNELTLHTNCRVYYIQGRISVANGSAPSSEHTSSAVRRSEEQNFCFERECFICARHADYEEEKKKSKERRKVIHLVTLPEFIHNVRQIIGRNTSELNSAISLRLSNTIDLVADNGRYHKECLINLIKINGTGNFDDTKAPDEKRDIFLELVKEIDELEDCQVAVNELYAKMEEIASGRETYSKPYFKVLLKKHYGDKIIITDISGKTSVACFRSACEKSIHASWRKEKLTDASDEEARVVEAAAAIISEKISTVMQDTSHYEKLDLEDMYKYIPNLLKLFLDTILQWGSRRSPAKDVKTFCIASDIMAAARPRSFLSPKHVAYGVYLHRKFGSRHLVEAANRMGQGCSYPEVQRFEYSATMAPEPLLSPEAFLQYVMDNADINQDTLTGKGTFHCMGGIKCVTPAAASQNSGRLLRVAARPSAADIVKHGGIKIHVYDKPAGAGLSTINVEVLGQFECSVRDYSYCTMLEAAYISAKCLKPVTSAHAASWTGYMQVATASSGPYDTSRILYLPFIMLEPSNPTAIKSGLEFAEKESDRHRKGSLALVTFDQPLALKAWDIITMSRLCGELTKTHVRLGGFHTLLSLLGAIGSIMEGSGLEEMLNMIYAPNTVKQIMSGTSYARAIRAHFLVRDALAVHAITACGRDLGKEISEASEMYEKVWENEISPEELEKNEAVKSIQTAVNTVLETAAATSRTAKLWKLYIELILLIRLFISAERTGNWRLHLHCVRKMIPIFLATAHNNYAKCAHLYLQMMLDMETAMSEEELKQYIEQGYFTIRRSSRFWSGVWTDMTIEQVLMRAIKSVGGLSRGRGYAESTLHLFILSMPACVEFSEPLEELLNIKTATSEQHVDLTPARRRQDQKDLESLMHWLADHSPFNGELTQLMCLSNGILATEAVNCDSAVEIGEKLLEKMYERNKNYGEFSLTRQNRVLPLAVVLKGVKVKGSTIIVNPDQLLHRMLCMKLGEEDLIALLGFELAPTATSLFDKFGMMRTGTKSSLQDNLLKIQGPCTVPTTVHNIIDGGYLLHKIVWPRPATYGEIMNVIVSHLQRKYGHNCTVIFDGYEDQNSIKHTAHVARYSGGKRMEILFTNEMFPSCSQTEFLSSPGNKTRFIAALVEKLQVAGIEAHVETGDADTAIAEAAISKAESGPTAVIANDTDILVILAARAPPGAQIIMQATGAKNKTKTFVISALQEKLGIAAKGLLFLHAMTGCDSTSAPYRRNKKTGLGLLRKNNDIQKWSFSYLEPEADPRDIQNIGEKFMLLLYASKEDSLNLARYYSYNRAAATSSLSKTFHIASLPPTSDAAKYHSYRAYYQVQSWLGKQEQLCPEVWGFERKNSVLVPVVTREPLVPEQLVDSVSCNCASDCSTLRCTCRSRNVSCTAMCGNCKGVNCANNDPVDSCSEDEEDNPEDTTVGEQYEDAPSTYKRRRQK